MEGPEHMSSTTVAEFASELKKSPDTLLEQLRSAGVAKSAAPMRCPRPTSRSLLGYLKASHGTVPERKKITLVKKSTSEIKQADASGKARTIQVEVRKKRTFVKRDEGGDTAVVESPEAELHEPPPPQVDNAELARREEEAPPPGRTDAPPGRRPGGEAPPARGAGAPRARGRGTRRRLRRHRAGQEGLRLCSEGQPRRAQVARHRRSGCRCGRRRR
jgi:hypothetical protein